MSEAHLNIGYIRLAADGYWADITLLASQRTENPKGDVYRAVTALWGKDETRGVHSYKDDVGNLRVVWVGTKPTTQAGERPAIWIAYA